MRQVLALCNCYNSPDVGELTASRPLAVAPFLGRYAFIDFTLSNFTNSDIDRIGVLTKSHPSSILLHLGVNHVWNKNTKTGFTFIMYNEKGITNSTFNTDIFNIMNNMAFIESANPKYILIAPVHFVSNIDYRPILDSHIAHNAEITAVYKPIKNGRSEFVGSSVMRISQEGYVDKIYENRGTNNEVNVSLETYIINRDTFYMLLKRAKEVSAIFTINDIVAYMCSRTLKVHPYRYTGFLRVIDSLQHYVEKSFEQLSYNVRQKLFLPDWPIFTRTHDTPPSKIGKNARVINSFLANGTVVDGQVSDSIISRNVVIEKNARVKHSLVFADSVIGKDCNLEYVIVDRDAIVTNVKELKGTKDNPIYIRAGVKI